MRVKYEIVSEWHNEELNYIIIRTERSTYKYLTTVIPLITNVCFSFKWQLVLISISIFSKLFYKI